MTRPLTFFSFILMFAFLAVLTPAAAVAQNVNFRYTYNIAPVMITEPPEIPGGPDFKYPDAARKNGVEGKAVVSFVLGEDSRIRDVKVAQGLPYGVTEALVDAVNRMYFKPAKNQGVATAVQMTLEFNITLVFDEEDPNVKKPRITLLPVAVYPESQRAEKYKDKVRISIIFFADGTLKVNGVNSVLPREFDKAAIAAAEGIKFEPAMHKKSQKPVAQVMAVEFNFKP